MAASIFSFLVLSAIVFHLSRLGTYYIVFDGETYTVWIRRLLGYNNILSGAYRLPSESDARNAIEKSKKNPPRVIES